MSQVSILAATKTENKSAKYLELAHGFAAKASEIRNTTSSFFTKKCAEEVIAAWRKCEGSDCEYTSYVNANAAEQWLEKAMARVENGI
jgi:hypothetical protein